MAAKITNIYASHWKLKMFEGQEILGFNPFDIEENKFLKIVSDQKESAELVKADGPYIVIAGSGMCDAGRVRNYLRQELSNPNSIICLVGYMAENTLGRRIKDGLPVVRMNSQDIMVRAEIANFESFSAHADSAFLTSYTKAVMENSLDEEKTIFINHGEDLGAACLKRELMEILPNVKIVIPKLGWEVELT